MFLMIKKIIYFFSVSFSYTLMTQCWQQNPQDRPDFSVLSTGIRSLVVTENGTAEETAQLLNQSVEVGKSTEYMQSVL
jgi:hypothetical protein